MARALLVRSIPLSTTTRNAWKAAGGTFARRGRTREQIIGIADSLGVPIINLGNSSINIYEAWNNAPNVRCLLTPKESRVALGWLMPFGSWLGEGYYWLKGPGRAGNNKERTLVANREEFLALKARANWIDGDIQRDIVGTEYRVITVAEKIVQVSKRVDTGSQREYRWVGVHNAPPQVKDTAREAANVLHGQRNIVGWDIMLGGDQDDLAYVLEGNSCPGVNEATACRILDAVEGIGYEG